MDVLPRLLDFFIELKTLRRPLCLRANVGCSVIVERLEQMLTAQNDRKGVGLPSTGKAFSGDLSIAAIRKKSLRRRNASSHRDVIRLFRCCRSARPMRRLYVMWFASVSDWYPENTRKHLERRS